MKFARVLLLLIIASSLTGAAPQGGTPTDTALTSASDYSEPEPPVDTGVCASNGPQCSACEQLPRSLWFFNKDHAAKWIDFSSSCIEKFGGNRISAIFADALDTGTECLAKLGTPMSQNHIQKLSSLILNDSQKENIECPSNYDFGNAIANAELNSHKMRVNPAHVTDSDDDLSGSVFHELFHNIGYDHGPTVEYAYTCEACCFPPRRPSATLRALSCKICGSTYDNSLDFRYVQDVVDFHVANGRPWIGAYTLQRYLEAKPGDRTARFLLLKPLSFGPLASFGVALGEALKEKYKNLSPAENALVDAVVSQKETPPTSDFLPMTRQLANAYLAHLDNDNGSADRYLKMIKTPAKETLSREGQYNYEFIISEFQAYEKLSKKSSWLSNLFQ